MAAAAVVVADLIEHTDLNFDIVVVVVVEYWK